MSRFAVVGATSWGVTLAWLLHRNRHEVAIITRTSEEARAVRAANGLPRLPELSLPPDIEITSESHVEVDGVVVAVPAQATRQTLDSSSVSRQVPVLGAAKGIEHSTGLLVSEVLAAEGWDASLISAISGPNLAHEIVRGLPAAAVIASSSPESAAMWQSALSGQTFRAYTSDDLVGVELAGAYKNVIAIAAGAASGLQFGANTVSTIMTRGLAEMTRLGVAMGANPLTFQGLAGVGDLATTCFSPLSRNRRFGELLASGKSVAQARDEIAEAIEGIATASVALSLAAKYDVDLPICSVVAQVVEGRATVLQAMAGLLARPLRPEATSPS